MSNDAFSRRDFLRTGATATAALVASGNYAHAGGYADKLKVGLVGCGGRGTDAARNCMDSSENVEIHAMGDLFQDVLNGSRGNLKGIGTKYNVSDDRAFFGWDAYKKVIASGVDMVILATPPGFRPIHLKAAVDAGKNVFMEKPVAVDAAGIKSVIESAMRAKEKGLAIVAGTQRRHQGDYLETMKRIHDGAIGDIVAAQVWWNQGGLWLKNRQPSWSDVENQIRNWIYYSWVGGDHIVEQHIHNIDVANWAMRAHPLKCTGIGGRQSRTGAGYGHVFDHFACEFEYPGGVIVTSQCKQQDGTHSKVAERIVGTKGVSNAQSSIKGDNNFRYDGNHKNAYVQEHTDLIASIRAGKPLNEGVQVAESTMSAIMGRMACYTGQEITWEMAMGSTEVLMPQTVEFGTMAVAPIAVPGLTKFA